MFKNKVTKFLSKFMVLSLLCATLVSSLPATTCFAEEGVTSSSQKTTDDMEMAIKTLGKSLDKAIAKVKITATLRNNRLDIKLKKPKLTCTSYKDYKIDVKNLFTPNNVKVYYNDGYKDKDVLHINPYKLMRKNTLIKTHSKLKNISISFKMKGYLTYKGRRIYYGKTIESDQIKTVKIPVKMRDKAIKVSNISWTSSSPTVTYIIE